MRVREPSSSSRIWNPCRHRSEPSSPSRTWNPAGVVAPILAAPRSRGCGVASWRAGFLGFDGHRVRRTPAQPSASRRVASRRVCRCHFSRPPEGRDDANRATKEPSVAPVDAKPLLDGSRKGQKVALTVNTAEARGRCEAGRRLSSTLTRLPHMPKPTRESCAMVAPVIDPKVANGFQPTRRSLRPFRVRRRLINADPRPLRASKRPPNTFCDHE